ncbi:unnamed protein product [Protopolystoma xenopodis]|uniref:Uncharacterized protein n=1 Tax=Protopolystoma xenopodis TaxID=117903 RepID=A0A448XQM6_9PLAT|nr:unnamed protein product [Protopolystoma xenopodis]
MSSHYAPPASPDYQPIPCRSASSQVRLEHGHSSQDLTHNAQLSNQPSTIWKPVQAIGACSSNSTDSCAQNDLLGLHSEEKNDEVKCPINSLGSSFSSEKHHGVNFGELDCEKCKIEMDDELQRLALFPNGTIGQTLMAITARFRTHEVETESSLHHLSESGHHRHPYNLDFRRRLEAEEFTA